MTNSDSFKYLLITVLTLLLLQLPNDAWALASNNVPLDSPIYYYLDKLAGFGLITSDIKGVRPYSKAEAARLVLEAEGKLNKLDGGSVTFAEKLLKDLHELLPREISLYNKPGVSPFFDFNPFSSSHYRYIYLDGAPRSYERLVHDRGGDGVFGIGSGLRPDNAYPSPAFQHGSEGTPMMENNEGIVYHNGSNYEFRFNSELYLKSFATVMIEPLFLYSEATGSTQAILNKGYIKLGGRGFEIELGRDSNWLGIGTRGAITIANNARNLDMVKISSPEPLHVSHIGDLKYSLLFSRLDRTVITDGSERQPYFIAAKLSLKPLDWMEFGINLGRQAGGPGVKNSLGENLRGIVGGTNDDNTNSIAGFELRCRIPSLRNTEFYGELSGEDAASFWPIVESYLAGFYIPRLTSDGTNDLRFEYFFGNAILYTHSTFREGYIYHGMPIGHSQGGATQEFFLRYSHWFSPRNRLALEYIHGERGNIGRVPVNSSGGLDMSGAMQGVERKNSWRIFWNLPMRGNFDVEMMYGWERVNNFDLARGVDRNNQIFRVDLTYRY